MSEPKKKKQEARKQSAADYSKDVFLTNPIASATDCTGLTPSIPDTENEAESYCAIADVPVTARDGSEAYYKAK